MFPAKTTLFISDIHLSPKTPELETLFHRFLTGPARGVEALYILGDLFDVWVGEDIQTKFQESIFSALADLAKQGVALFFMPGNRDFLLTPKTCAKYGITYLSDPTIITLHNQRVLLSHGDSLCTQDIGYQRYRRIAQHPITRFLFRRLPKKTREGIARKLRAKSQQYQQHKHLTILDVVDVSVKKLMQRYQSTQLIHGHVHRPYIHDLTLNDQAGKRVVLGDWNTKASLISATPDSIDLSTYCPIEGLDTQASFPTALLSSNSFK